MPTFLRSAATSTPLSTKAKQMPNDTAAREMLVARYAAPYLANRSLAVAAPPSPLRRLLKSPASSPNFSVTSSTSSFCARRATPRGLRKVDGGAKAVASGAESAAKPSVTRKTRMVAATALRFDWRQQETAAFAKCHESM
eukprot:scaffold4729_cov273-Pinguiococcus_pyrenoidosus.AAC.3